MCNISFLRRSYLKEHCRARYQSLLLQDKLGEHLIEVDRAARERG
ncbi:TnpV protein [Eubacterium sp. am_0171]|nr:MULTISPECIES: TnpV protein [unclassified Eubacterium (in: firmicutes)]MSC82732.1 TnpV protein [Eubacterium sp. BIOML-A1]MSD05126.1 TnpV protein [Eubacterium sp. BIOML-A2]RYT25023.1 TnpV protein [Eubacterium sp. am_0171]